MNNAEKFKQIFGLYATELWSMPESDFLEWLNRDVETTQIDHTADIGKKVSISCGRENDLIFRQAAIDALYDWSEHSMTDAEAWHIKQVIGDIKSLPSAQPDEIPLEWIDKHLEWLDNCDNDFAQLAKVSIKAMVELWKKDRI